jgi:hypothetical protein
VPLGTNYYRSPRLRLRAGRLLGPPPCILCKRPYPHTIPSLPRNASPSYLTILKHLSAHTLYLSLRIGEAEPFFRNTLLRWLMAGDRRKPSFPVPDWGTCHKRASWCPHRYDGSHPSMTTCSLSSTDRNLVQDPARKPSTPRPSFVFFPGFPGSRVSLSSPT